MTPNAIEILIHCHCTPTPHPREDAPAVQEELQSLLTNGLIEQIANKPGRYKTTSRGAAHIEQLCRTPWPTQKWVDAQGTVIEFLTLSCAAGAQRRPVTSDWLEI